MVKLMLFAIMGMFVALMLLAWFMKPVLRQGIPHVSHVRSYYRNDIPRVRTARMVRYS